MTLAFKKEENRYVATSLRTGNGDSIMQSREPVLAIFSRKKDDPEYHICYLNKNIGIGKTTMTEKLTSLLSPESFTLQENIRVNQASLNALSETYTYSVLEHDFQKLFDLQKTVYENECIDAYIQIQEKIENELRTIQQCNHAEKILERQEKLLDGADKEVKGLFEETKHMVLRKKEKLEHGQTSVQVAELRIRIPDIGNALKNAANPANAAALSLWKDVTIRIPLPPKKPFQAIARKVREIAGAVAEKLNAVIRKPEQEVSSFWKEETLPDMTMENGSQVIANGDFCEEKQNGYAVYTSAESFNMNVENRVEKKISTPEKPKETEKLKEKDDQQQTSWQEEEQEENKSEYDDLS